MVSLSITEAEQNAEVMGVQNALFMKNILKSIGLKIKLPLFASIDNSRAVDAGNNWSVGGRTCQVEVKQNFQWELKEAGVIEFQWVSTVNNESDMFTKNMQSQNTISMLQDCGHDKYYSTTHNKKNHE